VSDITPMSSSLLLSCSVVARSVVVRSFTRWATRRAESRSTLPPLNTRIEVRPPSLRHAPISTLQRCRFWLTAPAPHDSAPPLNRLPQVRADFLRCLDDIATDDARQVQQRLRLAVSLRELWHLRADVFRVVSVAYSQRLAEDRIASLNCHFPTTAPRSQFATL
jgi:hypothetical protein